VTGRTAVGLTACGVAALSAATAPPALPSANDDARATRIVERNWCDLARYDRARQIHRLSRLARRNLYEAAQVVKAHPHGCALAESVAGERAERVPSQHAPSLRKGCPRGLLALRAGDRTQAASVAAAGEPRSVRSVVVHLDDPGRAGGVRSACGATAMRRSVVVSLALTGYFPSASLSERVVAVGHFRHHGWRVWLLLH